MFSCKLTCLIRSLIWTTVHFLIKKYTRILQKLSNFFSCNVGMSVRKTVLQQGLLLYILPRYSIYDALCVTETFEIRYPLLFLNCYFCLSRKGGMVKRLVLPPQRIYFFFLKKSNQMRLGKWSMSIKERAFTNFAVQASYSNNFTVCTSHS